MKNKLVTNSMCAAVLVLASSFAIQAKPGDLDPTFGSSGVATTQLPGGAFVGASALQNDGKIVVVGEFKYSGDQFKPFIVRYNSDGSLDQTFGNGGIVTTLFVAGAPAGNESSAFYTVAIQPDGKIVAAGHAQGNVTNGTGYNDIALARFNTNGSPDASFGTGGQVLTHTGTDPDVQNSDGRSSIYGLAVGADGSIYSAGGGDFIVNHTGGGESFNPIVIKYSSSGGLLGVNRFVISPAGFAGAANYAATTKLQGDNKLVMGIVGAQQTIQNFVLVCLNPDLSFDTTFNGTGVVQTTFSAGVAQANGIVIDPDGKITASGSQNGGNSDTGTLYAARYKPDGSLDAAFGNGGKVTLLRADPPYPPGHGDSYKAGGNIVRQLDDKYVIALAGIVGAIRLLPAGAVDPTFGNNGIAMYDGSDPGNPNLSGPGRVILLQPVTRFFSPPQC
jgi:uncharacterized delta-60 repeat protein